MQEEKIILDGGLTIKKFPDGSKEYRDGKGILIKKVFPGEIVEDYDKKGKILRRKYPDKTEYFDENEKLKEMIVPQKDREDTFSGTGILKKKLF